MPTQCFIAEHIASARIIARALLRVSPILSGHRIRNDSGARLQDSLAVFHTTVRMAMAVSMFPDQDK